MNRWFNLLLLVLVLLRLLFLVFANRQALTTPFDLQKAHYDYTHSQYNLENAQFLGHIEDDLLYSYAGSQYVTGKDPASINFEVPFLGKYIYGFALSLLGTAVPLQYLFGIALTASVVYLSWQLTGSTTLSLIGGLLLLFEPLTVSQLFVTLLDLPHALAITLTFISATHFFKHLSPKALILTSVLIGITAATKLFITAFILWVVLIIFLPQKPKLWIQLTLPALFVYLVTFSIFFFYHPPLDFLIYHYQLFRFYRSYLPEYPAGQILRIIFLARWYTWWGLGDIKVEAWSWLWPLGTAASLILVTLKQIPKSIRALCVFVLLYLTSNLFHVVFPRYLLSIIPLLIVALIYSFKHLILSPYQSKT